MKHPELLESFEYVALVPCRRLNQNSFYELRLFIPGRVNEGDLMFFILMAKAVYSSVSGKETAFTLGNGTMRRMCFKALVEPTPELLKAVADRRSQKRKQLLEAAAASASYEPQPDYIKELLAMLPSRSAN